jgi:hypothetical protein
VAVWKWVQRFRPNRIYVRKRVAAFVIDETMIQMGNDVAWRIHFKRQDHAYS